MPKKSALILALGLLVSACGDNNSDNLPTVPPKTKQDFVKASEVKPNFISTQYVEVEPCSLDTINESPAQESNHIVNKSQVPLVGWAANVPDGVAINVVWLEFFGTKNFYLKAAVKVQRPDVASYFNKPAMLDSGWKAFVDLGNLTPGNYKVRILMPDAGKYLVCDTKRQISVE